LLGSALHGFVRFSLANDSEAVAEVQSSGWTRTKDPESNWKIRCLSARDEALDALRADSLSLVGWKNVKSHEFKSVGAGANPLAPNRRTGEFDDLMHCGVSTRHEELALILLVPGTKLSLNVRAHGFALKPPEKLEILACTSAELNRVCTQAALPNGPAFSGQQQR